MSLPVARSGAGVILLATMSLAMSGCWLLIDNREPDPVIEISNRTDNRLWIYYLEGDEEVLLAGSPLGAGATGDFQVAEDTQPPECTSGPVIARDAKGKVVARRAQPLCQGDTWIVRDR